MKCLSSHGTLDGSGKLMSALDLITHLFTTSTRQFRDVHPIFRQSYIVSFDTTNRTQANRSPDPLYRRQLRLPMDLRYPIVVLGDRVRHRFHRGADLLEIIRWYGCHHALKLDSRAGYDIHVLNAQNPRALGTAWTCRLLITRCTWMSAAAGA